MLLLIPAYGDFVATTHVDLLQWASATGSLIMETTWCAAIEGALSDLILCENTGEDIDPPCRASTQRKVSINRGQSTHMRVSPPLVWMVIWPQKLAVSSPVWSKPEGGCLYSLAVEKKANTLVSSTERY